MKIENIQVGQELYYVECHDAYDCPDWAKVKVHKVYKKSVRVKVFDENGEERNTFSILPCFLFKTKQQAIAELQKGFNESTSIIQKDYRSMIEEMKRLYDEAVKEIS